MLVYRFAIAREYVAYSTFTLAKSPAYKDGKDQLLMGGGTFYEFRLAEFKTATEENCILQRYLKEMRIDLLWPSPPPLAGEGQSLSNFIFISDESRRRDS